MDWSSPVGLLLLALAAYLCGSIPTGVIVARISGGPDPRTVGSGRTGGTNALRALGRKWAALVVAGDVLKGALPVVVARVLDAGPAAEVACGLAAVAGATRSVFLGFRGGRGVGTGVGTMLVIQPIAVLLAVPVFVGVILVTRYVSLGSLLGSAAMVAWAWLFWMAANGSISIAYPLYTAAGAAIVWLAHADNIDRLLHGKERKFDLGLLARDKPGGGAATG
jgi:acyl phosphate:glycerol-3-phosphate acyltransferase